ncbi:MAG: 3-oxoacyl-[acyl-carrier-protein] reductase [Desulfovibrio sp.]|uniref:3-oxoacyl-[acyl-carrier-protein] reductase n=1 Tax=Desulfovibrio sp. TaxID=885 RepID=UPI001A6CF0FE|nr:3-oxoacyl-[acyl-carrier-protein] reductase [Desulfovibrio sp.]MBD5416397.1 3-oxoacyl-[acyl-carrier-protein] reductase [Desulfovibrio sp.]
MTHSSATALSWAEAPVALVTGGSRGIGRAIARTLARDGYFIILTYVSRPEDAERTVEDIRAAGGEARAFALDVGDDAAVEAFFASEIKDKVNLAVLVNNAGITRDGFLIRMKSEDFDRVLDVNLGGAFACSREAAKIMSRRRAGRIINIASVVGQMGNAGQANYCAAKAGLIGLTKSNARELAARGITVNAVAPGFIETDMTAKLGEDVMKAYVESIPLRRMGTADDVAEAVAFLASDRAAYITGQVLAVNGGLYC